MAAIMAVASLAFAFPSGGRLDAASALLRNRIGPQRACPEEVLSAIPIGDVQKARARVAVADPASTVLQTRSVLTASECARLRRWATPRIDTRTRDSVDGEPECQVTVPADVLRASLSNRSLDALVALADAGLDAASNPARCRAPRPFSAFVRKYSPKLRRRSLPFHVDDNDRTVNVALTADEDVDGGWLLALHDGRVRRVERQEGDATVHSSHVCHAVTDVRAGVRWALILFFQERPRSRPAAPRTARPVPRTAVPRKSAREERGPEGGRDAHSLAAGETRGLQGRHPRARMPLTHPRRRAGVGRRPPSNGERLERRQTRGR